MVSLPPEASHVQAADDDDAAIENSDPMTENHVGPGVDSEFDSLAVSAAGHRPEPENRLEGRTDGGILLVTKECPSGSGSVRSDAGSEGRAI